jgi:histidinol-phosphate aminotransferase
MERASRKISEYRNPELDWLDKNESFDSKVEGLVKQIIADAPAKLFSAYPNLESLYSCLAEYLGVDIDNLYLGNGSEALIKAVFEIGVLGNKKVLKRTPSFAMYDVYSEIFGAYVINENYYWDESLDSFSFSAEQFLSSITEHRPAIIFIANPDSPTGNVLSEVALHTILEAAQISGSLVCIDAVYDEFQDVRLNYHAILNRYQNVVILYSASKCWGLAGVRLGYALAAPNLIKKLHGCRPMYEIGNLQACIFEGVLQNLDVFYESVEKIRSNKNVLTRTLVDAGYTVASNVGGNFINFRSTARLSKNLSKVCTYRDAWIQLPMNGWTRLSVSADMDVANIIQLIQNSD